MAGGYKSMMRYGLIFAIAISALAQFPPPVVRNQYTTNTTGIITNIAGVNCNLTGLLTVESTTNLNQWARLSTNDMVGIYTATEGYVPYAINTTNLTNSIIRQSSSRIGIGTSAPDRKLEINTGAETGGVRISYNDGDGSASVFSDVLVDSGGDLTVTTVTNKTIVLQMPVWDDLMYVPTSLDFAGATDPSLVNYQPTGSGAVCKLYEFALDDIGYFSIQLPHSYKVGTDILIHLHWTPGSRGTEEGTRKVGWKVLYSWANIGGTFPAMQIADLSDACQSTDDQHLMTPEFTIDGHTVAKGISSMLICNITRTDTGTDDTWVSTTSGQLPMLLEIDFHFQMDTIGSRQSGTK